MKSGLWIGAGLAVAGAIGVSVWYQQKNGKEQQLSEQCKAKLKLYGDKFEGLYGATSRFLQKENSVQEADDLCFRWEVRLENEKQVMNLRKKWEQLKDYGAKMRIEKWYGFLVTVGVKQCEEKEVSVDRTALQRYDLPDNAEDYMGKRMQVEIPCWMLEEIVLEKGTLV